MIRLATSNSLQAQPTTSDLPQPIVLPQVDAAPQSAPALKAVPTPHTYPATHDAPFQNHDALIWPIERAFMTTTAYILERMSADMVEVKRDHGHIEYWPLEQMGWSVAQLDRFCRPSLERALKAISEANALAANENKL